MNYIITVILGYFIIVPAFTSLIKLKQIDPTYYPFIILLWLGVINQIIGVLSAWYFRTNTINSNIYSLIESVILLYQFFKWKVFQRNKFLYKFLFAGLILGWFINNFIIGSFKNFNSEFTIGYSLLVVLLSISRINKILSCENRKVLKNADFILCMGFIIFFTYNAITEISWKYGMVLSDAFKLKILTIFTIVNLLINLLFLYAILCMRRKLPFSIIY